MTGVTDHQLNMLKENIQNLATKEGKSQVDLINELLAGAAASAHWDTVNLLLEIRWPLIQPQINAILSR